MLRQRFLRRLGGIAVAHTAWRRIAWPSFEAAFCSGIRVSFGAPTRTSPSKRPRVAAARLRRDGEDMAVAARSGDGQRARFDLFSSRAMTAAPRFGPLPGSQGSGMRHCCDGMASLRRRPQTRRRGRGAARPRRFLAHSAAPPFSGTPHNRSPPILIAGNRTLRPCPASASHSVPVSGKSQITNPFRRFIRALSAT